MISAVCQHLGVSFASLIFLILLSSVSAEAKVRSVTLSTDMSLDAPRWIYEKNEKVEKKGLAYKLYLIRKAQRENQPATCIKLVKSTWKSGRSFQPWLLSAWFECSQDQYQKDKKLATLTVPLNRLTQNQEWLVHGSAAPSLREQYSALLLEQLEAQLKGKRNEAWKTVDQLQEIRSWLSSAEKARLYRLAGELAFVQQNLLAAQDFILRSLAEQESRELRKKLESIRSTLLGHRNGGAESGKTTTDSFAQNEDLDASQEERKIYERMKTAMQSGDLVSAVEDGIQLLEEFPGGRRADWAADRIQDIYLSIAYKSEKKYHLLRQRVLRQMKKADGARLYSWALKASSRNFFNDCLDLGEQSLEVMGNHPDTTKILRLTARCALFAGEYGEAEKLFRKLSREHAGTKESAEAFFRLGLIYYRQKEYDKASAALERLMVLPNGDDYRLRGLYWYWRSQQRAEAEGAQALAEKLVKEYPLTYYGLRARAELNNNKLVWPDKEEEKEPLKTEMWLTETESLAWERLQVLLKAGWFKEAQAELQTLPHPQSAKEKVIHAKLWALAFDHYKATRLVAQAWEEDPSLVQWRFVRMIYPLDFDSYIKKEAKERGLQEGLVRSVIRQESSFRPQARSHASAMGLMQLVPPTAREVAGYLRFKNLSIPDDLYVPKNNIRFGTYYLWRLMRAFDGHVPLALAAYNAGIGNIRRWMGAREVLADLESRQDLRPESELWVDELAWSETSFYVKAILRNLMIYQLISDGELNLDKPVWK